MSLAADKALAAARTRFLAERLPERDRDRLLDAWSACLDQIDAARSEAVGERVLRHYREGIEARLTARFAHLPLEEVP